MSARKSCGGRKAIRLNETLDKNLRAYATAATADPAGGFDKSLGYGVTVTAVGLGILACPLPAHAKIVYTPAHVVLNHSAPLDLNHDGINDFSFGFHAGKQSSALSVGPPSLNGNAVVANGFYASALPAGVRVGGGRTEPPKLAHSYGMAAMRESCRSKNSCAIDFRGQWANDGKGVKNRYLGFKFMIEGKVHYGWARVTVDPKGAYGVLTGYAYETIPNKAIITGKTKGPDEISIKEPDAALVIPTRKPASLGLLAMGSPGLAIWRRNESGANTQ